MTRYPVVLYTANATAALPCTVVYCHLITTPHCSVVLYTVI